MAHESTHVVQQGAESDPALRLPRQPEADEEPVRARASLFDARSDAVIRRQPDPDVDPDRIDDDTGSAPDDEESLTAPKRPFKSDIDPRDPRIVYVPADAERKEIARELIADATRTDDFYFVSPSEFVESKRTEERGIRFYEPTRIPDATSERIRQCFETKLSTDVDATYRELVGSTDDERLAALVLRWSEYSEYQDAAGTSYFERYLQGLDARSIETHRDYLFFNGASTKRTAYEQLFEELDGRAREMVLKAITLRSTRTVGYTVTDKRPELAPGDAVGRWFSVHDQLPIRLTVAFTIAPATTRTVAESKARNSPYLGARVVVRADADRYAAYAILYDTVPGSAVPGHTEAGDFDWYYPGTIFIGPGDLDPTPLSAAGEQALGADAVGDALALVRRVDASPLFGLDYAALRHATVSQRVAIFDAVLNSKLFADEPVGLEVLTRTVLTIATDDFPAFERALDAAGLTSRLLALQDNKLRARLAALGQAITYQSLSSLPLGPAAFADMPTLVLGETDGAQNYIIAKPTTVTSRTIPRDAWVSGTAISAAGPQATEPALAGEQGGYAPRTAIAFTSGSYPLAYSMDTPRWSRRGETPLPRPYLPTELVSLEINAKGKKSQRIVSALEASLLQGNPHDEASEKDFMAFLDTVMLIQAGFGVMRLGSMAARAAAASSLRAGITVLGEELATQTGKAAVRSVVDYALLQAAHYAQEHSEELQKTVAGRLFLSTVTAATVILATRDIGHLLESGIIGKLAVAGRDAILVVGAAAKAGVRRTLTNFEAAGLAWKNMREAGALELVTNAGGFRVMRPRSLGEFGVAFRKAQGELAREELFANIASAGGKTERAEAVLGRLEGATKPGKGKGVEATDAQVDAARTYRDVARKAAGLKPREIDAFFETIEKSLDALKKQRRSIADVGPFLRAAMQQTALPVAEYLALVEKLSATGISRTAFAELALKASRTGKGGRAALDLPWLMSLENLAKEDLEFMALDSKTPWNLFRDAALNPKDLALQMRARARARGVGAEMVAGENAATAVPGFKVDARQVEAGTSELDYALVSTDRVGRRRAMEVKGWTKDTWVESIDAYERAAAGKRMTKDAKTAAKRIEHMLGQLEDAKAISTRGERPVLAITDALGEADVKRLKTIISGKVGRVDIVTMKEAEITGASGRLRGAFGFQ